MNLTKKQRLVLKAIKQNPAAANNDAMLYATCWELEGWDDNKSLYENLRTKTRGETLSRRRRELFNAGLITYTKQADKAREEAYVSERDRHSDYEAVSWLKD